MFLAPSEFLDSNQARSYTDYRVPIFLPLQVSAKPHIHQVGTQMYLPFLPVWLLRRLLESQLQSQKRSHENEAEALRGEIQSLKEENNRQQQLLAQNLQLPPEARIEASLQHEITRLTNENLVRTAEQPPMLLEQNLLPGWERCRSLPHSCDPLSLAQTQ